MEIIQNIFVSGYYKNKLQTLLAKEGFNYHDNGTYITLCNMLILVLNKYFIIQRNGKIIARETDLNRILNLCYAFCGRRAK